MSPNMVYNTLSTLFLNFELKVIFTTEKLLGCNLQPTKHSNANI